jgi:hypothetical protein
MAEFEEIDLAESDPRQYSASSERRNLMKGSVCLILIGLAIWLGWFGWGCLQRIGWIEQSRVVDVHMSGDWLAGEYRSCQTDGRADVLFCPNSGESQTDMAASGQTPRSFSVGFYGNITGKPEDTLNWKCKRETDSISCHALR